MYLVTLTGVSACLNSNLDGKDHAEGDSRDDELWSMTLDASDAFKVDNTRAWYNVKVAGVFNEPSWEDETFRVRTTHHYEKARNVVIFIRPLQELTVVQLASSHWFSYGTLRAEYANREKDRI